MLPSPIFPKNNNVLFACIVILVRTRIQRRIHKVYIAHICLEFWSSIMQWWIVDQLRGRLPSQWRVLKVCELVLYDRMGDTTSIFNVSNIYIVQSRSYKESNTANESEKLSQYWLEINWDSISVIFASRWMITKLFYIYISILYQELCPNIS